MAILREIDIKYRFKEVDCHILDQAMDSPEKVASVFDYLKHETKELFLAVNLSSQHTINSFEVIAVGSVKGISLRPAEVLRGAIILTCPAMVLVHNHPSGVSTPSRSDIGFTKQIVDAAKLFDINILDHVIIGLNNHTSIRNLHPDIF
jgi:DNA repair protein RadC